MKLKLLLAILLSIGLLFSPLVSAQGSKYQPVDRKLSKQDEAWVRKTLKSLTLDEKIGQMIMADANVVFWNRQSEEFKKLQHHIVDNKVGGVLVFRSEVLPTALSANRWQTMAKVPLFVSSDLEMGMGMRFDQTPWWPPNMAVAATGDEAFARLQGQATAIQARAIGVNWLFAPAVDVNNNPDNPVINVRSYGEDPTMVAAFAKAFIEGAQGAGALTCAKHFPGHGDTATDSHIGLPVVDVGKDRLMNLELIPFRAAIASRVAGVMSAHIALPQIETELAAPVRILDEREVAATEFTSLMESNAARVTLPGTLSPKILTGLLREELKFNGLIVTDAMNMAGISARYTAAEAAVKAIKAGADIIEKSPDIDAAVAGIKQAVASGEISESRINASAERILRAKAALGLHRKKLVDLNEVDLVVNHPSFNELADNIAEHSITLARDKQKLLPVNPNGKKLFNLTFTDEEDRAITKPFIDELTKRNVRVESLTIGARANETEINEALARLESAKPDVVIYSVAVRARSGKGSVALPAVGKRLAQELVNRRLPMITISFGNPYMLLAIADSPSYLLAYSPFPVSQRAAAKAVCGEIPIKGQLPISLPGLYPMGYGLKVEK